MNRRSFLGVFAGGAAARVSAAAAALPNIVVILVDDMGFSDIGCYGGEIPTPNIDRLASRGLRFTQFYNTARCSPSRASLLTGLYPHQAGMGHLDNDVRPGSRGYQGRLVDQSVTIAEALQPAGYFTAMTGKWHLGQQHGTPPWTRGFHRSLNHQAGGIYYPNQRGRSNARIYLNGQELPLDAPEVGQSWYSTDLWTQFGLRFIDQARQQKKPFFLYLAHNAPHFPLMAPDADIQRFRGHYLAGWDKLRQARYERQVRMGLIDPRWPLTERPPDSPAWDSLSQSDRERFDHMMAIYAATVHAMDRSVGRLVDGLAQRGVLDHTLILFMSDNGGNAESGPPGRFDGHPPGGPDSNVFIGMNWATLNNTPFRRYKHFTHEGGIATPLIAHWPASIPQARQGRFEAQPAHLIDILPTVLAAAGAKYPPHIRGRAAIPTEGASLVPAFSGRPVARKQPIFFMHEGNRAVRDGQWKLVSKYGEAWELFDMQADRTEMRNLAAEQPAVVARLSAAYDAWAQRTFAEPWSGPPRTDWGQEIRPPGEAPAKKASKKKP
ncbi:MAG: arylsulfatase [Acidobacteria bacterium]|nr:arylsulfatase [Acidobacteriota bacterium]